MLTNTPYLRTGLFLALLFTLSAGFYQVVSYQLSLDHRYEDNHRQQISPNNEALHNGTVELPLFPHKGRVYVDFTVDLAGQLQNARLAQKADPALAAEVMRLIGLQQGADLRWTPGKIKGTPRAMNATLQVSFGMRCKGCEQVMVEMVP